MKTLQETSAPAAWTAKKIALLAILFAAHMALNKFGVIAFGNIVQIGFAFLVVVIVARYFDLYTAIAYAIVHDTVGVLVSGSQWYWGFLLSAILGMLFYWIGFHGRHKVSIARVILTVGAVVLIVDVILNTLWIAQLYHLTTPAKLGNLISARLIKEAIVGPIQGVLIYFLLNNKTLANAFDRFLK